MLKGDDDTADNSPTFANETERRHAIKREMQHLAPGHRFEAINRIRALEGRAPITDPQQPSP